MNLNQKVLELAEKCLPDEHHFIVEARVNGKGRNQKIIVIADGDKGIDIDTCAKISHKMSEFLDQETWFESSYILEVSSPGADEPMVLPRQYPKNIGRKLSILTAEGQTIEAILSQSSSDGVVLQKVISKKKKNVEPEFFNLSYDQIRKASVIIDFKSLKELEEKEPLPQMGDEEEEEEID